jgi:hypothetical protein
LSRVGASGALSRARSMPINLRTATAFAFGVERFDLGYQFRPRRESLTSSPPLLRLRSAQIGCTQRPRKNGAADEGYSL